MRIPLARHYCKVRGAFAPLAVEGTAALSFAVTPTKHAYIGCERRDRPPFIINSLR
jgi:hypothetical protein